MTQGLLHTTGSIDVSSPKTLASPFTKPRLRWLINGLIGAICGKSVCISIENTLLTCSGHESLLNAEILHRDISIDNIMLTEKEEDGFLIDLDLANKK